MTVAAQHTKVRLSRQWFNPLYFALLEIANDSRIRTVAIYGGKSSAKTFSISQFLVREAFFTGASSIGFRKESTIIQTTIKKSFNKAIDSMRLGAGFAKLQFQYRCISGAEIVLKGLDDPEKGKGVESYKYVLLDEANHFTIEEYETFQTSLRGIAGQKIFLTWNPVSEKQWVKTHFVDAYEWTATETFGSLPSPDSFIKISSDGTAILIKTDYRDNYWICGHPSGAYGYRDENLIGQYDKLQYTNYNRYRVEVRGEWGVERTGGEFWKQFDESKHVKPVGYIKGLPLHVTIDNNVTPYVTVTAWQLQVKQITQTHELPCRSPDNTATKAANRLADLLDKIGYQDVVFLYGDPSANARSTTDDEGKSFFQKFIEALAKRGYRISNRVLTSAPSVSMSAAFINDIYEGGIDGYTIAISDQCTTSIDDYASVKEAADGSMLKVKKKDSKDGPSYEPHGHISDTKRYFIIKLLDALWQAYRKKRKGIPLNIAASNFY